MHVHIYTIAQSNGFSDTTKTPFLSLYTNSHLEMLHAFLFIFQIFHMIYIHAMLQQYPEHRKTASKQWIYACRTVKISAASEYSKILQVEQWHSIDTQEFLADTI